MPFEPTADEVVNSPDWLEIKFYSALKKLRQDVEKPQAARAMANNQIICAVSAAALVTGFVPNPPNLEQIVIRKGQTSRQQRIPMVQQIAIGSKKMTELLHRIGQQPKVLAAEQAHAISMRFSKLFHTQVSPIYSVNGQIERTDNPDAVQAEAYMALRGIVEQMKEGDRIYLGKKENLEEDGQTISIKGHAIAGIRLNGGIRWFGTNKDWQFDDTLELGPKRAGYKFKYYIVRGGSPQIVEVPDE